MKDEFNKEIFLKAYNLAHDMVVRNMNLNQNYEQSVQDRTVKYYESMLNTLALIKEKYPEHLFFDVERDIMDGAIL